MGSTGQLLARLVFVAAFLLTDLRAALYWDATVAIPEKLGVPTVVCPYLVGTTLLFGGLGGLLFVFNSIRIGSMIQVLGVFLQAIWLHGARYLHARGTDDEWPALIEILTAASHVAALYIFVQYENQLRAQREKYNKTL